MTTCGNGILEWDNYEYCDDGNLIAGDGCGKDCIIEDGWDCTGGSSTTKSICNDICGDGKMNKRNYAKYCDDGNQYDGDGCSRFCEMEYTFTCAGGNSTTPDTCTEACGDGINLGFNDCEDTNKRNGDGCSSTCKVEPGWFCELDFNTGFDTCSELCGDGRIFYRSPFMMCDDGNSVDGDGCSLDCSVEDGWTCAGGNGSTPDTCNGICGDSLIYGKEQCEDGNTINGDGCSSTCMIEKGWNCSLD